MNNKTIGNTQIKTFTFANETEVKECHVVITVSDASLPFHIQLKSLTDAYSSLLHSQFEGFSPVMQRFFLSDAANQEDEVRQAVDMCFSGYRCATSFVEQAPLNGTKIALWAYLMSNVATGKDDLCAVTHGQYTHFWNASSLSQEPDSRLQTMDLLEEYSLKLQQKGCSIKDNCIRTWFFVNDIDNNYSGVVDGRNEVFQKHGLTKDTHFIASTGIAGRQKDSHKSVMMDSYAIKGIASEQIKYLQAPTHLNRTSDYGVSFERGTSVDYGDRRHVFISGTASINNRGEVVHVGDITKQTERTLENIEVLLAEAECKWSDVAHLIVYLRDISDYSVVSNLLASRFPDMPLVIVHAPVCRPTWLIEAECMAVKSVNRYPFPSF